ncbi:hypothetical protein KC321_g11358, partial [Hortaea werneckii]
MATFPTTIAAIALVLLVLFLLTKVLLARPKHPHPLPPGPAGLPLLGNLFDLPPTTGSQPEYLHWLAHKDRYGPISSITVLGQTMVIIHDRGIAGEVLEKKAGTSAGRPGLKFAFD